MSVTLNEPRVLEELSWTERQLPQYERTKHVHGLHPYLGKYVPQLVEYFLKKYFTKVGPSTAILDPFAGSGTTLVECNVAGKPSFGLDISEFNALLTRVKLARYDIRLLEEEIESIIGRTLEKLQAFAKKDLDQFFEHGKSGSTASEETASQYLNDWYHPKALIPLLIFRSLISDYYHQDFFRILLSRAARSARLASHHELDSSKRPQTTDYECHKHHRTCHPTTRSLPFLVRYASDMLTRVSRFQEARTDARAEAFCWDARKFDYSKAELCGVITSPPYVGLIDYHEQHRYAYELLGLRDRSPSEIGSKSEGNGKTAVENYKSSVAAVLKRVADGGLRPPGVMVVVVNDRLNLYSDVVEEASLRVKDRFRRRVDRRTGRRAGGFLEDILVLSG